MNKNSSNPCSYWSGHLGHTSKVNKYPYTFIFNIYRKNALKLLIFLLLGVTVARSLNWTCAF